MHTLSTYDTRESLQALSAYVLPNVEFLVCYFHSAAGFPVRDTWLHGTKYGNYSSWPGLTYINTALKKIFGQNYHGPSRLI